MSAGPILRVALSTPLKRLFDYLPPAAGESPVGQPGARVRVPFGRSTRIGVIAAVAEDSELPREKLRRASEVLDAKPLLNEELLSLLRWAADYYQYPLGEVLSTALPTALRQGKASGHRQFTLGLHTRRSRPGPGCVEQARTGAGTNPGRGPSADRRHWRGRSRPTGTQLSHGGSGTDRQRPAGIARGHPAWTQRRRCRKQAHH